MKTMPLILLAVIINATAQLLLKAGTNRIGVFNFSWSNIAPISLQVISNPFILAGLACYVLAVIVWILVLSRTEVSVAYPMISLAYILNAIAAYYFFNEDLSLVRIAGIGVIIFGVYLIART
jgi:drug/metabolite transporter (DMT)-like permease